MANFFSFSIKLPFNYRIQDFLAFHNRDSLQLSEVVKDNYLAKGVVVNSSATLIEILFNSNSDLAKVAIASHHDLGSDFSHDFEQTFSSMLGLSQDIQTFETQYIDGSKLGYLISKQAGLRVPLTFSPFEALSWAIIGQQISVRAATSIRRNLVKACNIYHKSGLACYPDHTAISDLTIEQLRKIGFSSTKAQTLHNVSLAAQNSQTFILSNPRPLVTPSIDELRAELLNFKGVGPWTVDYTLLRGYGWLDGSLHGDAAVRRGLSLLIADGHFLNENETKIILEQYSPFKALLAAHVWASLSLNSF